MYYNQAIIFGEASVDLLNVKDIDIYGTNCVADVSTDDGDCVRFVSAKEKYFDVKVDNGTLTVTQKSRNLLLRLISGRIEFKLILTRGFNGRLRYRNNNGGLYIKDAELADIELSTKNGKFDISSVTANAFSLKMKNGSIAFKSLTVRDACAVKCKNGDSYRRRAQYFVQQRGAVRRLYKMQKNRLRNLQRRDKRERARRRRAAPRNKQRQD